MVNVDKVVASTPAMMTSLLRPLFALSVAACASTEPSSSHAGTPVEPSAPDVRPSAPAHTPPARTPPTAPVAPSGPPAPSYPVGAIALPCRARVEMVPSFALDQVNLRFNLVNLTDEPVSVSLRGTCPGGMVELRGLPTDFDPMHRCQAGACTSPNASATYTLAARAKVLLGETTLHAKGDACNPPLPLGSTMLEAKIVPESNAYEMCGSGALVHLVRDPGSGALRQAQLLDPQVPATPAPPAKPTPAPAKPAAKPDKHCPACGFGCPNGIPSTKLGPDGCPTCSCERLDGTLRP